MTGPREAFPELTDELVKRYDEPAPRYTSYPTANVWTPAFGAEDYGRKLEEAGREGKGSPLALYFHLPFCRSLCTYCGCNVVITKKRSAADDYIRNLALEMDLVAARLGERRRVSQLHWGGGTPTFLDERQLEALMGEIGARFELTPDAEVAVEVHPGTTSLAQIGLLRALGFNRLSIGIQDFDARVLEAIRRRQTVDQTREIVERARALGFQGINFDLIFGLPFQTEESWRASLERVLELAPDRVAVYSLAYVPELRPHQRNLRRDAMAAGRAKLELFRQAHEAFVTAGYVRIGMDHFARPEDELAQALAAGKLRRTFQGYTVKPASDLVGFGLTGISDLQGAFAQNVRTLPEYHERVSQGKLATERGYRLSEDDRVRRAAIEELMCQFSLDLGARGIASFEPELERFRALEREGLLVLCQGQTRLELTAEGRLFVRNVARALDAHLPGTTGTHFSRTV
jgi:oxygen-independent coproporphyrinogen-3 oxidase